MKYESIINFKKFCVMMKKTIFSMAAATVLLMGSCAQSEDSERPSEKTQDVPVLFSTYVGKSPVVKAGGVTGEITGLDDLTSGFGVFAYYTDDSDFNQAGSIPNFMYNQMVEKTGEYSPVKYWPNEVYDVPDNGIPEGTTPHAGKDKLTFFAYAPFTDVTTAGAVKTSLKEDSKEVGITAITNNEATGAPVISYTCASKAANFVDLMYAEENVTTNRNQLKPAVGSKIAFTFKHALAKIAFKIQGVFDKTSAPGETKAAETTITVTDLKLESDAKVGNTGKLDLADNTWKEVSTSGLDMELLTGGSFEVDETAKDLTDASALFIPGTDEATFTVTITYEVATTDANVKGGKAVVVNKIKNTAKFTPEKGKKYTLKLLLGMTSVKMTATVSPWEDATPDKEVWLPINQ